MEQGIIAGLGIVVGVIVGFGIPVGIYILIDTIIFKRSLKKNRWTK